MCTDVPNLSSNPETTRLETGHPGADPDIEKYWRVSEMIAVEA